MTDRSLLVDRFVAGTRWEAARRLPLAGDASARRYERWQMPGTGDTCVFMDAGPSDPVAPFIRIARHLSDAGFSAPLILAEDRLNGFLLIEDFGDTVFARLMRNDPGCEAELYEAAVDVLVKLQGSALPDGLTRFTPALMAEQAGLVLETYAHLPEQSAAFCATLETIIGQHLSLPEVLILRDYHAENLIWLPGRKGVEKVGLLDFQDALAGPVGYDLVSLVHDARRDVAPDLADHLVARFVHALDLDPAAFGATRAVLCAQRNLRILGVFARLARVQGKTGYIDLIPRVWNHVMWAMAHPALRPLAAFVDMLPRPSPEHLDYLRARCAPTCR